MNVRDLGINLIPVCAMSYGWEMAVECPLSCIKTGELQLVSQLTLADVNVLRAHLKAQIDALDQMEKELEKKK